VSQAGRGLVVTLREFLIRVDPRICGLRLGVVGLGSGFKLHRVAGCVFRPDLGTDSGLTWAPVPGTWAPIPGHLGTDSGALGRATVPSPLDDIQALEQFISDGPGSWTLVWLPSFFSPETLETLADLIAIRRVRGAATTAGERRRVSTSPMGRVVKGATGADRGHAQDRGEALSDPVVPAKVTSRARRARRRR